MDVLLTFLLAFFFSFIGTIPPGTINLTIVQLGLEHKINIAWRFAIATSLVEYPYAWLAIEFENLITSSPAVTENMQLITAFVMIILGGLSLLASEKPGRLYEKFSTSGFRRGILLGILNPLALPFWVGVTAYLKSNRWIDLSSAFEVQAYLLGVTLGALVLLMLFAFLARKIVSKFQQNSFIKKIPGLVLLVLGVYALIDYLI